VEEGNGQATVLLHGLFGAFSNFGSLFSHFKNNIVFLMPLLPIYDSSKEKAHLNDLWNFWKTLKLKNSLDNI